MILLVTQAMPQMRAHAHPNLGRLVTPRHYPSTAEHEAGLTWAADNDCFQGLDAPAWLRMLDGIVGAPGRMVFATVPDVVGDARATAADFERWAPEVERRGLPVGLVAQDGIAELGAWLERTWPRLSAVFLGGTDAFKLGPEGEAIAAAAKRRGLWLHMGRVNTERRLRYAATLACDSVDGTKWTKWRTTYLNGGLAAVQAPPQLRLEVAPNERTATHDHR